MEKLPGARSIRRPLNGRRMPMLIGVPSIVRLRRLAAVNCLDARSPAHRRAVGIIGSSTGRGLGQNRALGRPVNRFLRDVAVGVIRQWDRRSNADDAAQQDIQRN
jgi:hypothetical protein